MRRGAKPGKAKVEPKRPVARKSRKNEGSRVRDLEKHLAESLEREKATGELLQERTRASIEALEQQTATSEILRVISSSPTDIQPVFDTIASSARRLLGGHSVSVSRVVSDELHLMAFNTTSAAADAVLQSNYPMRLDRAPLAARVMRERTTAAVTDIDTDPEVTEGQRQVGRARGFRSFVWTPMVRDDVVIGIIAVTRREPGAFTDSDVALLQTFADQAVIAIENTRLFKELEARNRDLTATSEILRVISSSPTDVQPVFNTIAESATRLCEGFFGFVTRFDGRLVHFVAHHNLGLDALEKIHRSYPLAADRDTINGLAIIERRVVHVSDVEHDRDVPPRGRELARIFGFRSVVAVPILRDGESIGSVSVARDEAKPFTDAQVALLKTFADQAVIAIENVRLFTELQARNRDLTHALEQQTATAEVLRVIGSSPTDAQPVFEAIVSSARRLLSGFGGAVYRVAGDEIHLAAYISINPSGDAALRSSFPRPLAVFSPPGEAIRRRAPVVLTDIKTDGWIPDDIRELIRKRGDRSGVWVPMMREGVALGAIGVTRSEPGGFAEEQIELLRTFADQDVIAIENVRLFKELQTRNA